MRRTALMAAFAAAAGLAATGSALAHPHAAENARKGEGQVIANGQNHPVFVDGESCLAYGLLSGFGPAWYGLETAHHGPDAGEPGKADGCYMIEGRLSPLDPASDRNPGLR